MKEEFGGIILCGGKSTRFGSNKGAYKLQNKEMIKYSIDLLRKFTKEIIIAGPNTIGDLSLKFIDDIYQDAGPMGGLYSSLKQSKHAYNIVLACDIPFIQESTITKLIKPELNADIRLFQTPDKKYHPLIGLYHKRICNDLESHLKNGHYKLLQFIFHQSYEILELSENKELKSFININYLHEAKKYN